MGIIQQSTYYSFHNDELIAGVFRSYSWKLRANAVYLKKKITHINFNDKNIWQEQLSYVTLKYEVSFSFFGVIAFGNRPEGLLGGCWSLGVLLAWRPALLEASSEHPSDWRCVRQQNWVPALPASPAPGVDSPEEQEKLLTFEQMLVLCWVKGHCKNEAQ